PVEPSPTAPPRHRFGFVNDDGLGLPLTLLGRIAFGRGFCLRRNYLATRRGRSVGGHSTFARASQDYCHPRRRKPDQRRYFLYLLPFRSRCCHDRRIFADAGELAVPPRGRGGNLRSEEHTSELQSRFDL